MLHLDSHLLARFLERTDMDLRKGRGANGLRVEGREELVDRLAGVGEEHVRDGLDRRDGAFILEWDECCRPLQWE